MSDNYAEFEKNYGRDKIIHRSKYGIITNSLIHHYAKRERRIIKNKSRGWGAPSDKPYAPLGKFNNVLDAFQVWKTSIPHTKEIRIDTLKSINFMKNTHNPILKGKPLKRWLDIVKSNKYTLDMIKASDKSKSFYKFGHLKTLSDNGEHHDSNSKTRYIDNKRLNTPYFKLISNIKDGSNALKEQISLSVERMKKARHGHSIDDIYQEHDYSFYLPDKTSYISDSHSQSRINSGRGVSTSVGGSKYQSKIFKTEVIEDESRAPTIRVKSNTRANTSLNRFHKKNRSVQLKNLKFRELKNKYTTEMQHIPIQDNSINYIMRENSKNNEDTK